MASFGIRQVKSGSGSLSDTGIFYDILQLYYRSVTRSYYRGAAGAILVYDITKLVAIVLKGISNYGSYMTVGSRSQTCLGGSLMPGRLEVRTS